MPEAVCQNEARQSCAGTRKPEARLEEPRTRAGEPPKQQRPRTDHEPNANWAQCPDQQDIARGLFVATARAKVRRRPEGRDERTFRNRTLPETKVRRVQQAIEQPKKELAQESPRRQPSL